MKTFEYTLYCAESLYTDRVEADDEEQSLVVLFEKINKQWEGYFEHIDTPEEFAAECLFIECTEIDIVAERIRDAAPNLLALLEVVLSQLATKGSISLETSVGLAKSINNAINRAKGILS